MKINREKLDLALARNCKTLSDLKGVLGDVTLTRLRNDRDYLPNTKTVGKLALTLGCDPMDLIETEGNQ